MMKHKDFTTFGSFTQHAEKTNFNARHLLQEAKFEGIDPIIVLYNPE